MSAKRIFMLAGELSGDMHAAALAEGLRSLAPEIELMGMGGERMRAAGVEILKDSGDMAAVGFAEVVRHLARFRRIFKDLLAEAAARRPDAVVLVDYPGMNLRFARAVKRSIPAKVIYYICPQVWAWHRSRIETMARCVDRAIVIFEFERKLYAERNIPVSFVGHPLLDRIDPGSGGGRLRGELSVGPGAPLVGLLPGSRGASVGRHLPVMARSAGIVLEKIPGARFAVALAPGLPKAEIERICRRAGVEVAVLEDRTYDLMCASDMLLVGSGTATLEAAIFATPMVVMYKTSFLSYALARMLVRVPYIALPNIIAGRRVVTELIQAAASARAVSREALAILEDGGARERMKRDLEAVRSSLGTKGASLRAAEAVLETIG